MKQRDIISQSVFGTMNLFILLAVFHAICGFQLHLSDNQENRQEQPLSRSKRLIISTNKYLWTGGIVPYVFDSTLPKVRRREYEDKVFPVYEKYSCIKFVKWTATTKEDYSLNHNNYLIFEETNQCISKIGRAGSGGQRISCCYWKTCLHEIGHALGLHHEHTSPIRNQFIRINKENIKDGVLSAFSMKTNVNTYSLYDSDSIMHYGLKAWNKNGKPTLAFLDPDTRPLSKFANTERYFYLFMEINDAYKCTENCNLNCENGGYVAIVRGKCSCRCPEGLDPNSRCTTLLRQDYPCGSVIELNDQNPNVMLESEGIQGLNKSVTCYWFVKSPENTRIFLDFPVFHVRDVNGECLDEVAVRPYLPGMIGSSYCGKVFKKTVQSDQNVIGFSFTQTASAYKTSSFVAKASFIHENDFCYNLTNGGQNYNGKVKFAVDSSPCLPWYSVGHCNHNLFDIRDADKNLAKNFCRNPDNGKSPWCYTNSDGCVRNYCDACNFGKCEDLIGNCNKKIKKDPTYCKTNSDAPMNCRKACGLCDDHQPLASFSTTFCDAPTLPPDAEPQTLLNKYSVGETITIKCKMNSDFRLITCLSDGNWTPLSYVCGTCRPGWTNYGTICYRFFNEFKQQVHAQRYCTELCDGCCLLRDNTRNHGFVKDLIKDNSGGCKSVWLDLTEAEDAMVYTWSNGNVPDWTNWLDETKPTGLGCVSTNSQCTWTDKKCGLKLKFVCQYIRSAPLLCEDQRGDCGNIMKKHPDFCDTEKKTFAQSYCAKTCGLC